MNTQQGRSSRWWMLTALACTMPSLAQKAPAPSPVQVFQPCTSVAVDPPTSVTLGKSSLVRLSVPVVRMVVGGLPAGRAAAPNAESVSASTPPMAPGVPGSASAMGLAAAQAANDGVAQVDITLLSPTELFFLGRRPGSMNLVLQAADGRCFIRDVQVTVDPDNLQAKLAELMPGEGDIKVRAMDGALVLTGQVSDALKLDQVMNVASSLGEGRRVVNMMRVAAPQQVMVEVKIAEVSKSLLDRFGIDYSRVFATATGGGVVSGILGGTPGVLGRFAGSNLDFRGTASAAVGNVLGTAGGTAATPSLPLGGPVRAGSSTVIGIDAQSRDGLIRVLAEPNIMAISGQPASFLSGGKIFIPVAQNREFGGGLTTTLEEKEFGVGLKFTPTVLDAGRVNLKLTSEVSELAQTGSAFTTVGGVTSVLPSISTRRVDTTVQLGDGQSFAIAGLIKNNSTQSISRFPGLGDVPILGVLFRSTEFQKDQTELVFVVTPRLVKPAQTAILLPTDVHTPPSRSDVWLGGKAEGAHGSGAASTSPGPAPAVPAPRAVLPTAPVSTLQE
jgi:pilus assembly protein CpaC